MKKKTNNITCSNSYNIGNCNVVSDLHFIYGKFQK